MGTYRTGVVGITGYTGVELARLLTAHPMFDLCYAAANTTAGSRYSDVWPGTKGLVDLPIQSLDVEAAGAECDLIFFALPHGHAARIAPGLLAASVCVVDLGADFRLEDPEVYRNAYGLEHASPDLLSQAVYGLVEWERQALESARLIANPGCYPTAVALAARPLVEAGLITGPIVANCMSGVSGAGRNPNRRNRYCEVAESVVAYGVGGGHRHTPEMEQSIGHSVCFTPHLVPINRGISATVQAHLARRISIGDIREHFVARYADETMVVLRDEAPSTSDVRGSNRAHLYVALDEERQMVTVISVIDNLIKGAAGQAIQAANVALGIPEATGLPLFPLVP